MGGITPDENQDVGGRFIDAMSGKSNTGTQADLGGSLLSAAGVGDFAPSSILLGNNDDPGMLGMGHYHPQFRKTNDNAANVPYLTDTMGAAQMGAALSGQRLAPTVGYTHINQDPANQWRGQQQQLADNQSGLAQALMAQAQGNGPSVAQLQLNQASDRNLANTMAMANSQRGMASAGNMRALANQTASLGQQRAADSAQLRLQEQMQAYGMANQAQQGLGSLLANSRSQDIGLAQGQAGLNQGTTLANQQARLGQTGLNDAQTRFYSGQGADMQKFQAGQTLDFEKAKMQQDIAQQKAKADAYSGNKDSGSNMMSGLSSMGSMAMSMFSDERLKTDIKPAGGELSSFLDAIGAHSYRYKDEKHGKGEFVSPMAQELLKSKVGRSMVEQADDGLKVNYGRGFGAMLASQAELHRRLKRLEGDG